MEMIWGTRMPTRRDKWPLLFRFHKDDRFHKDEKKLQCDAKKDAYIAAFKKKLTCQVFMLLYLQ